MPVLCAIKQLQGLHLERSRSTSLYSFTKVCASIAHYQTVTGLAPGKIQVHFTTLSIIATHHAHCLRHCSQACWPTRTTSSPSAFEVEESLSALVAPVTAYSLTNTAGAQACLWVARGTRQLTVRVTAALQAAPCIRLALKEPCTHTLQYTVSSVQDCS